MSDIVLGASHLADADYEIQRTNNFEISIPHLLRNRMVTLAVVSGFLPSESNEVITLNYGNTKVTVAGAATPNGSGTLVVRDFLQEKSDIEEVIDEWRASVYSKSDKNGRKKDAIGFAADYKKPAKITQYAPDGTYLRVWDLVGCWPSAVDYGTLSYDSAGVKSISITLQYDRAILNRDQYNKELAES